MLRKLSLALTVSALITSSAAAQKTLDAAKKTWTGLWEGPVWHMGENDPIGGYRLEIAHDTAWKVSIDVITQQTVSAKASDFAPDGNRATWNAALMGMTCKTSAAVDGDVLKGETTCGEHGGLTFTLKRKQ